MTIEKYEAEAMIETALKAVQKQYVIPLALALETLTRVLCVRNPDLSVTISDILKNQAGNCRENDAAGFVFLEYLAERAASPEKSLPGDGDIPLRTSLWVVDGGEGKNPDKGKGSHTSK